LAWGKWIRRTAASIRTLSSVWRRARAKMRASAPSRAIGHRNGRPPADARRLDERKLLLLYHRDGDVAARAELVLRLLPLAHWVARRYDHGSEPFEDLVQVASVGLLKAIDRFESGRGAALASYAVPVIEGEIKHHFRDSCWTVRVPRAMHGTVMKVSRAVSDLSEQLGRAPSQGEVAEAVGVDCAEVAKAMQAAAAYEPLSIESFANGHGDQRLSYLDAIAYEDRRYELIEKRVSIEPALRALEPRDRLSLYLRFVEELSYAEVAERVGISATHASRLVARALARLETVAASEEPSDVRARAG
jgi:RNA polymerase sigma-B factor